MDQQNNQNGSWYSTGFSKTDEAAREMEGKKNSQNALRRFFMKPKTEKNVIFVDDTAFEIWEHNIKMNGKWNNNFQTCIGKKNGCLWCKAAENEATKGIVSKAYYASMFSIIDLTGWVDNKGKTRDQKVLQLLAAKADVAVVIKHQKNLRPDKSLVACQFNILRTSDQDFSTGSSFSFIKKYKVEDLLQKYKPIDYMKILVPLSAPKIEEMLIMLQGGTAPKTENKQNASQTKNETGGEELKEEIPYGEENVSNDDIPF